MVSTQTRLIEVFRKIELDSSKPGINRSELATIVKRLDPSWTDEGLGALLTAAGVSENGAVDLEAFFDWLWRPAPQTVVDLQSHFLSEAYADGHAMDVNGTGYTLVDAPDAHLYSHADTGIQVLQDAVDFVPPGDAGGPRQVLFCYVGDQSFTAFLEEVVFSEATWSVLKGDRDGVVASTLEPGQFSRFSGEMQRQPTYCIPVITTLAQTPKRCDNTNDAMILPTEGVAAMAEVAAANSERRRRRIMEVSKQVKGLDNPRTLAAMNDLAFFLEARGKLSEATTICQEAFKVFESSCGANHASTLTSMSNLAYLLELSGQVDEAENLCRRALAGREATLGKNHADTQTTVYNLAQLLEERGKIEEAEQLFFRELQWCKATYGSKNFRTKQSIRNMKRFSADHNRQVLDGDCEGSDTRYATEKKLDAYRKFKTLG